MQKLITKFIDHKKKEGASKNTLITYERVLNRINLEELFSYDESYEASEYFLDLKEKFSSQTVKQYLIVYRTFLKFLQTRKLIEVHYLAEELSVKIKIDKQIRNLSFMQQGILFNKLHQKDKFIFTLFIETGIRMMEFNETLNLLPNYSSIDGMNIKGKGNKIRTIFVSSKVFNEYQKLSKPDLKRVLAYSLEDLRKIIKGYSVHINKAIVPHMLRHTFGYNWVNNGGAIDVLQIYLGHNSITTTLQYAHLDNRRVRQEYQNVIENGIDQTDIGQLKARIIHLENKIKKLGGKINE